MHGRHAVEFNESEVESPAGGASKSGLSSAFRRLMDRAGIDAHRLGVRISSLFPQRANLFVPDAE